MQVAHIILAHKDPLQLKRLVESLQHPSSVIFIHIDKRKKILPFTEVIKNSNVHFVSNRVKVNWGGFSQVQAFINSMSESIAHSPDIEYMNFLSGQDYPVKTMSNFYEYLSSNPKSAFMEYVDSDHIWLQQARRRIAQYHITDIKFFGQYKVEKLINTILPVRKLPPGFELVGRSQWFTIDRECVLYVLDFIIKNKKIVNCFKYSWGADELFFQSVIYNSHLKDRLINNNLRYIDWSEGQSSPKILTLADLDALALTSEFFARKFDCNVDDEVLDYIDKTMLT